MRRDPSGYSVCIVTRGTRWRLAPAKNFIAILWPRGGPKIQFTGRMAFSSLVSSGAVDGGPLDKSASGPEKITTANRFYERLADHQKDIYRKVAASERKRRREVLEVKSVEMHKLLKTGEAELTKTEASKLNSADGCRYEECWHGRFLHLYTVFRGSSHSFRLDEDRPDFPGPPAEDIQKAILGMVKELCFAGPAEPTWWMKIVTAFRDEFLDCGLYVFNESEDLPHQPTPLYIPRFCCQSPASVHLLKAKTIQLDGDVARFREIVPPERRQCGPHLVWKIDPDDRWGGECLDAEKTNVLWVQPGLFFVSTELLVSRACPIEFAEFTRHFPKRATAAKKEDSADKVIPPHIDSKILDEIPWLTPKDLEAATKSMKKIPLNPDADDEPDAIDPFPPPLEPSGTPGAGDLIGGAGVASDGAGEDEGADHDFAVAFLEEMRAAREAAEADGGAGVISLNFYVQERLASLPNGKQTIHIIVKPFEHAKVWCTAFCEQQTRSFHRDLHGEENCYILAREWKAAMEYYYQANIMHDTATLGRIDYGSIPAYRISLEFLDMVSTISVDSSTWQRIEELRDWKPT